MLLINRFHKFKLNYQPKNPCKREKKMAKELCSGRTALLSINTWQGQQQHHLRRSQLGALPISATRRLAKHSRFQVVCQSVEMQAKKEQYDPEFGAKVGQDRLLKVPVSNIRNFCIIAHIDHGKSTLADKLLQMTGTVQKREMKEQFLDNMDLERERGITIKLQAARMRYMFENKPYCLNLIDTPGHVDFSYEVSRSLAACEGALLVVDASQGVEAQTLANVYLALENNLEIIPVLNKIDLPGAEPDRVIREIEEVIGLDCTNAICCSAKEGIGITEILNAIVERIPPPRDGARHPLRALIFDSYYDPYRGVIAYFRIIDGRIKKGDKIYFMATKKDYFADEIGVLSPNQMQVEELYAGEVGYLSASIRSVADARVGDTVTHCDRRAESSLPGYEEATPMVFCGLFPVDADQFPELHDALEKLQLNDAALKMWLLGSSSHGNCTVLQERLEREYNLSLITTAPSVVYRVNCVNGDTVECSNPSLLPEPGQRRSIEEPFVKIEMLTSKDYIGPLMELAQDRRGEFKEMKFITENRASIIYELPLAEMVGDFFDQMKSRSKGYASMEYTFIGYKESELIKLDIQINGDRVEPLSTIVHKDKAYAVGRALTQKLKDLIPRQMFKVPIQACIGSKVIASESLSAIRKDVLAKCYGGDISRKKKLLKKQAEGKKRMKAIGKVDVPQEAFMAVLKLEKEVL
ncbi:translation factor GUF1 homolog, chloroplastic isoform X2 [Durio zibethinus]|uniref:Translation factor GUF1 homolog, mitochondrial n=1 Tax=Durio zibethinus TaxID=66656 RepID=A0A6P5YMG3_DURZI|nr:translation factor GUF1 homolog, chloroplastic isoform X2 [Durio zibethinus]